MITIASVNLRSGPSLTEPVLKTLPKGTAVSPLGCTAKVGAYTWLQITALGVEGWVANTFVGDSLPTPTTKGARVGLHILNKNNPAAILDMLRRLNASNTPVPLITLCLVNGSNELSVAAIKQASPKTKVIARLLDGNDYNTNWDTTSKAAGRQYFEDTKGHITADAKLADWIQIWNVNEPWYGTKTALWWQGVMEGAQAMGIHVAVFCFSVGFPPLPQDGGYQIWKDAETYKTLRLARINGHAFMLHQYAFRDNYDDEYTVLRHHNIFKNFPSDLQDMPLWIAEYGESYLTGQPQKSRDHLWSLLQRSQGNLSQLPMATAALWTLGDSGGWSSDRWDDYMEVYESYVRGAG